MCWFVPSNNKQGNETNWLESIWKAINALSKASLGKTLQEAMEKNETNWLESAIQYKVTKLCKILTRRSPALEWCTISESSLSKKWDFLNKGRDWKSRMAAVRDAHRRKSRMRLHKWKQPQQVYK